MKIKPFDFIIFCLPLIIAAAAVLLMLPGGEGGCAVISVDGQPLRRIELASATDEDIDLGLRYGNIISVRDGKIGVCKAECSALTCVHTGYISRAGQSIVCAASRLCITIEGTAHYDARTW